jgi:DNA polymerase III epsilon subunit-like protein
LTPTPSHPEFFIVIDVETSGPNPANYAMLSIGACTLTEPRQTFYIELKPEPQTFTAEAMQISNLSLERLSKEGQEPKTAMLAFESWLAAVLPKNHTPIFTAFNAPFDWMFVNDYFFRYLNRNPFGHKALDIKAWYMGLKNTNWENTSFKAIVEAEGFQWELSHHALDDAIQTANLFQLLLEQNRRNEHVK